MTAATRPVAAHLLSALAQRTSAAVDAVTGRAAPSDLDLTGRDLDILIREVMDTGAEDVAWITLTAIAGCFPREEDVRWLVRVARGSSAATVALAALDRGLGLALRAGTLDWEMDVVGGTVVDVDSCARSDFHNGIQRVVRETVRNWLHDHELELVAWSDSGAAMRHLTDREWRRAAEWGTSSPAATGAAGAAPAKPSRLVVPWRARVMLVEVPTATRCQSLAALARYSGNVVVAIGYDAIPLTSADLRPLGEAAAFSEYLTVLKYSRLVAGISQSATQEFSGFAGALAAQGLGGPDVDCVPLPSTTPSTRSLGERVPPARPVVLLLGRLEPHKNHAAVLFACERLWREGLDFEVRMIGGTGWDVGEVSAELRRLRRSRRPVRRLGAVSDDELWQQMRDASITVFLSLHEGYGLPVAESLACGTPVLTSSYGSQSEIAAGGGCVTVNPRDDEAIVAALRELVGLSEKRRALRAEIAGRPERSWQQYAEELWQVLTR